MQEYKLTTFEKITCGRVEDLTTDSDDVIPHLPYLVGIAEATNKYFVYNIAYAHDQVCGVIIHTTSIRQHCYKSTCIRICAIQARTRTFA